MKIKYDDYNPIGGYTIIEQLKKDYKCIPNGNSQFWYLYSKRHMTERLLYFGISNFDIKKRKILLQSNNGIN